MNIDISDIKSFITVAEIKSISGAAHKLNILQSNMTAKIKKIENHYKRQMFIRKPKGVDLTDAGLDLYQQYKKVFLIWEDTENQIHQQDKKLKFGTNTSLGATQFSTSLNKLYEYYSNLSITLKTGTTDFIEQEVLSGNIDLGYVYGSAHHKNLQYIGKGQDELVLLCKQQDGPKTIEEALSHQNILSLSDHCCYSVMLNKIYEDFDLPQGNFVHIGDIESLIQFSQLGLGITLATKSLVARHNIDYFIEIPKQYRQIDYYLIARSEHTFTPIEKHFIELNDVLENDS